MLSPPTPASSPLAHLGSKSRSNYAAQMFQSSPLSQRSSPLSQPRRRREYKPQSSSRSNVPGTPSLSGGIQDTPQKQFLRDRFKARCIERMRDNRAREIRRQRRGSSVDGSSSDGFDMDDDSAMGEDDEFTLDDELYRRVMMNEERRARHSKLVSFERDFGSSIDPSMYEDMETLEQELTGKPSKYSTAVESPPEDIFDDELIQEYLAELEETPSETEQQVAAHVETGAIDLDKEDPSALERVFTTAPLAEQPSPTKSMYSDYTMSSPPSSPPRPSPSTWSCPFCAAQTPRTDIACMTCMTKYPMEHAAAAWIDPDSHPEVLMRTHVPLATVSHSIGVVMLCGAPGCDWCYAL